MRACNLLVSLTFYAKYAKYALFEVRVNLLYFIYKRVNKRSCGYACLLFINLLFVLKLFKTLNSIYGSVGLNGYTPDIALLYRLKRESL